MALFGNESDKIKHLEDQAKPQPSVAPSSGQTVASDASASISAYLDRGTKITGELNFDGPAKIDGHVEGEIKGIEITIGDGAVVTAQINAESVVVCGKVEGDVIASKRIEIRPTGKIAGNVTAPVLVIQEGGQFEGHCAMAKGLEEPKAAAHHNGAQAETRTTA